MGDVWGYCGFYSHRGHRRGGTLFVRGVQMSAVDHPVKSPGLVLTDGEQVAIGAITIKMMQGLLFSHFAKRGRGRPRKNAEVPRLIRGFKSMVNASGIHLTAQEETVILEQLLNQSLF